MNAPRCRDCGAAWEGLRTCHCPTCHRTFSVPAAFDMHRTGPVTDRRCLDPGTVLTKKGEPRLALLARKYECWGRPSADDEDAPSRNRGRA